MITSYVDITFMNSYPYMAGDEVTHQDKIWISEIDNNV